MSNKKLTSETNRLFESSDSDEEETPNFLNLENNYAKKYNDWRRKEVLQKLKDKYGENLDVPSEIESGSGSDDDDDESDEESNSSSTDVSKDELFDEQFLKVYSALKSKDPEIYYKTFNVPTESQEKNSTFDKQKKVILDKSKKLTLQQYHQKLIEEKKGITEEDEKVNQPKGYYEELYNIRSEIKDIVNKDIDENESSDEQLFSLKNESETVSESKSLKTSHHKNIDQDISKIWDNQKLDKNDEFLKDFIINKRYLNENEKQLISPKKLNQLQHFGGFDNKDNVDEKDEDEKYDETDEDEEYDETDEEKVSSLKISNFHYEEPDANVIKRYPRSMTSVRDTIKNEKKSHRAEVRQKKKKEKELELKKLRKLKREETESKIKRLKEISGNQNIDINDLDLNVIMDDDNEFDMEKYDQKMQLIFGDSYYNTNAEDYNKPSFEYIPEIDDHLYEDEIEGNQVKNNKKRNKKETKNNFDIMADDNIGTYEDIIGKDIATRFKYRMVEPNDFGLTDEEILFSNDTELNQWCSLKKMSQFRSSEQEKYDKKVYALKKKDMELKKKIFKSLYEEKSENVESLNEETILEKNQAEKDQEEDKEKETKESPKKKKGKKRRNKKAAPQLNNVKTQKTAVTTPVKRTAQKSNVKRKRKQNNSKFNNQPENNDVDVQRLKAYGLSNREIKKMKITK